MFENSVVKMEGGSAMELKDVEKFNSRKLLISYQLVEEKEPIESTEDKDDDVLNTFGNEINSQELS